LLRLPTSGQFEWSLPWWELVGRYFKIAWAVFVCGIFVLTLFTSCAAFFMGLRSLHGLRGEIAFRAQRRTAMTGTFFGICTLLLDIGFFTMIAPALQEMPGVLLMGD
jgi:hypothetical protein